MFIMSYIPKFHKKKLLIKKRVTKKCKCAKIINTASAPDLEKNMAKWNFLFFKLNS